MAPNHGQIFPDRGVSQELANERIPVSLRRREEHNPRRKPIDPVHDKGLSPPAPQLRSKQGKRGGRVHVFSGNGREPGRFIDSDYGLVFVKNFDPWRSGAASRSPWWMISHVAEPAPHQQQVSVTKLASRMHPGQSTLPPG